MVDGTFSPETCYLIRNPDVVRLVFMLFDSCLVPLQIEIITRFTQLAELCARNRDHLCGAHALERVLMLMTKSQDPTLTCTLCSGASR